MRIRWRIDFILFTALFLSGCGIDAQQAKCDKSLLKGDEKEFTFSKKNELACTDGKEIKLGEQRYAKLMCDPAKGWINPSGKGTLVNSDPATIISVECVLKPCDVRLIKGFDNKTMEYAGKKLKCKGNGKAIKIDSIVTKELTCFLAAWAAGKTPTNIPNNETIEVSPCFETTCDGDKIDMKNGVKFNAGPPATLSCGSNNFTVVDGKPHLKLKCEEKWQNSKGEEVKDAHASFSATCEEKACHKSLVTLVGDHTKRTLDKTTGEDKIQCEGNDHELKIDNGYFKYFICDKSSGWSNGATQMFEASGKFKAECVEKTCIRGNIKAPDNLINYEDGKVAKVHCVDRKKMLLVDNVFYAELTCEKGEHWKEGNREVKTNTFKPSCVVKACHVSLIDGHGIDRSAKNKVTCKDKSKDIRVVNSSLYAVEFTCDKSKGWMVEGSRIEDAESRVAVECLPRTCHMSLLKTTSVDQFKFTQGKADVTKSVLTCTEPGKVLFVDNNFHTSLECIKDGKWTALGRNASEELTINCVEKACHESFVELDGNVRREANTLTCPKTSQQLHIRNSSVFTETLSCDAKKGWSDGTEEIKGAEDAFSVHCTAKTGVTVCDSSLITGNSDQFTFDVPSKENSIEILERSGNETGNDEEETKRKQLSCKDSNLWLSINGSYHRNELFCNVAENKWEGTGIDGDDRLNVECVQLTSCKEAFPLNTSCDSAWEGCQELAIVEPEQSVCPEGMNMFYKKKNTTAFDMTHTTEVGAALQCDKNAGWRVKWSDSESIALDKGDVVICAARNPSITTTTTTTESIEDGNEYESMDDDAEKDESVTTTVSAEVDAVPIKSDDPVKEEGSWFKAHMTVIFIIAGSIAAAVILGVAMIVVYKVFAKKRASARSDESSKKLLDDKKNKKKIKEKHGQNDAILDDQVIEPPAEIKL